MGFRVLIVAIVSLIVNASVVEATEEFAIETEVYSGMSKHAQARNLTIFSDRVIYDFSIIPEGHVTVFDRDAKRFTVADKQHRIQASLTIGDLVRFVATEQARAANLDVELIQFAAKPQFEVEFDEASGQLNLMSPVWDYRVETTRVDDALLDRYNEFATWYTQLNALFRPIPPSIRMQLNEQLAERKLLPTRVLVDIKRDGQVLLRQESRHRLITKLSDRERSKLQNWQNQRGGYRLIPFLEYHAEQMPVADARGQRGSK